MESQEPDQRLRLLPWSILRGECVLSGAPQDQHQVFLRHVDHIRQRQTRLGRGRLNRFHIPHAAIVKSLKRFAGRGLWLPG